MTFASKRPRGDGEPTTYNLLFVCTGNTCRSPLAAAITRHALEVRGWSHVSVRSAGVAAGPASPASEGALDVAGEHGFDLSDHQSQSVTPELLEWADLILAMGSSHLAALAELGAGEKTALITDFLEGDESGTAIEDPFGGDTDSYRATYGQLEHSIDTLLERLEPILSP